jgi:hypothetical protein
VRLVWAPTDELVVKEMTEEEFWGCGLRDLLEYDPLVFSPPEDYEGPLAY